VQRRPAREHVREERAGAAADVEDRARVLERQQVRAQHGLQARAGRLRVVERTRGIGMRREVREEVGPVRDGDRVGALGQRGEKLGVRHHRPRRARELDPPTPTAAVGEEPAHAVVPVAAAPVAAHAASRREVGQQSFEPLGRDVDARRELGGRARRVEVPRKVERHECVQRGRVEHAREPLQQHLHREPHAIVSAREQSPDARHGRDRRWRRHDRHARDIADAQRPSPFGAPAVRGHRLTGPCTDWSVVIVSPPSVPPYVAHRPSARTALASGAWTSPVTTMKVRSRSGGHPPTCTRSSAT
jgi:hypothetical protein